MSFDDVNDDNEEPSDTLNVGEEDYEYWDIIGFDFYVGGIPKKFILYVILYLFNKFFNMYKHYIVSIRIVPFFSILPDGYIFP
jgi:hypothetical protein